MKLPEDVKHLYASIYAVPFGMIKIPEANEEDDDEEHFFRNPRMNTEAGQNDLMDKRRSAELRESIKHQTMLNPLVCRWVEEDGEYYPQLVGGDRRYRALDFLIRKNEIVRDPRVAAAIGENGNWEYKEAPAAEAYALIPCQVFSVENDLDALALSWAENKNRIDLTEGCEIAEVINLRNIGADDEKICEILQRDEKWLAETDKLVEDLDASTLTDLLENRMTRATAIELGNIENIELRDKVRVRANEVAQESCSRKVRRIQKQLTSALDERELAEGSVAEAEFNADEAAIEEAEKKVAAAEKKVVKAAKERDEAVPVASVKNVRDAKEELSDDDDDEPKEVVPRLLRAAKLKEQLEYIDALIQSNGQCLEDTFVIDVDHLKLLRLIINNNIMANDADFAATIRYFVESQIRRG